MVNKENFGYTHKQYPRVDIASPNADACIV